LNRREPTASRKGTVAQMVNGLGQHHRHEPGAFGKSVVLYLADVVWDVDSLESFTSIKRKVCDFSHRFGQRNRGESLTTMKRVGFDACYRAWNVD
jgi:hypothetical protein